MIFPLLRGLLWFHRAPVTWIMVALNVVVFAWSFPAYRAADQAVEEILDDDEFVAINGLLFASTVDLEAESKSVRELIDRALAGSEEARVLVGHLALRRADFLKMMSLRISHGLMGPVQPGKEINEIGDAIAIARWRQKSSRLLEIQDVHPSYRMGLSQGRAQLWRWFTYQIAHSGFVHLFWNMIFLLIFGTFVEHSRGSLAALIAVWGAGVAGAFAYVLLSGLSASPLVGASAAVSGLIAVAASKTSRRLPFVYWLLPIRGYYGVAWLPAWVLIPAFVLPDLSGWLSAQPGLTAVAYTAHIGGAVFGFTLGQVLKERPDAMIELAKGATGSVATSVRLSA